MKVFIAAFALLVATVAMGQKTCIGKWVTIDDKTGNYKSIVELTKKVKTLEHHVNKAHKRVNSYEKNLKYIKESRASLTKEVYSLIQSMNELKREVGGSK